MNILLGYLNAPHIHIMINHFPVILAPVGTALMLAGLYRGSEDLKKAAAWTFVITGLFAGATFISGDMAADRLVVLVPGVSGSAITGHDNSALYALVSAVILALFSLWSLFKARGKMLPVRTAVVILAVSVMVSAVMGRTAFLGGKIRHTEIIPAQSPSPSAPVRR